jgi:hypothetical protein
MIGKIDKLWFRFLQATHRWLVRRAEAHCHREKQRRFRRLMILADGHHWKN